MSLSSIAERLTSKTWTPELAEAYMGPRLRCAISHAAEESVRARAASGGSVSALLIAALESRAVEGCLVARTTVEGGRARLGYFVATTPEEVLSAQGSTYVAGDFVREALPLIEAHEGRIAVVCLPCEATALRSRPEIAAKVELVVALFCGHASKSELIDHVTDRLAKQAGAPLADLRFRSGHWRGVLTAHFENGVVIEKPFSVFGRSQNLYYASARKCLACGDHFGYAADISAGDLWSAKYKDDSIKHTALVAKTERGAAAIHSAEAAGQLVVRDVDVADILDGQRRVAPFHYNVSARAQAGRGLGVSIPDPGGRVVWHERLAARIVLKNAIATDTAAGLELVLARPTWYHKLMLYVLKGLESFS